MSVQINLKRGVHFSPLRYPGGKTLLTPFFDDVLKKNELFDGTYIEPYAGGAGAGIALLLLEKISHIIINDLDPSIYSFWKSILDDTEKFIDQLSTVKLSVDEWRKQHEVYRRKSSNQFELGFATFYLNRTNRSGIIDAGPIGGLDQKGKWKIDARFNRENLINRILRISYYRDRIVVSNDDGVNLLRKNKRKSKVFIYLDPPYYQKGGSLYLNHYKKKDHEVLADFLNSNNQLRWLLTYDDINAIKDLYSKRRMQKFPISYSAYKKIKGSEVMIFSDNLIL